MAVATMAFVTEALDSLKAQQLFRRLRVLEGEQRPSAVVDGRRVINLSSNNYLGLTTHPRLREAALKAIHEYGVGSGSVRTIAGTMTVHEELERRLARFKKTEATLVLQSGFTANLGVIGSLMDEGDLIISDELNHASVIDGCRLTHAARRLYPHKDMDALKQILEETDGIAKRLVITDTVFSMDGDICPLPDIVRLCREHGAMVMVDDAHGSGVLGSNGRGTVDHFGLHGQVEIQVGTLSKAIGVLGGYMAGSQELRDLLIHRARPFLFSTSHPPCVAAACIAAIEVMEEEPELVERLWDNTKFFKGELVRLGFDTGASQTPITPVIVGEGALAMRLSDRLFEEGVFGQGIAFPTVPRGKARVRTIVTAAHTRQELEQALDAFSKVGKELGII